MKYILIHDKDDSCIPWMLLKVDANDYVIYHTNWQSSLNGIENAEMFRVDERDPVHVNEVRSNYTLYSEATTLEEIKLLALLEN